MLVGGVTACTTHIVLTQGVAGGAPKPYFLCMVSIFFFRANAGFKFTPRQKTGGAFELADTGLSDRRSRFTISTISTISSC